MEEEKKFNWKGIVIVVIIFFAAMLIVGSNNDNNEKKDFVKSIKNDKEFRIDLKNEIEGNIENEMPELIDEAVAEILNEFDSMVEYKSDYMDGCTDNGSVSWAYCDCTFNFMDEQWSNEKILQESISMVSGIVSDDTLDLMIDGYAKCSHLE